MTGPPLLSRDGNVWTPAPEAKGPFPGLHGGSGAGAMEGLAAERDAGQPLSLHAHFLRPVPVAPGEVRASTRTLPRPYYFGNGPRYWPPPFLFMLIEPTNNLLGGLAKRFCTNAACPGSKFRVLHAVRHIRHPV